MEFRLEPIAQFAQLNKIFSRCLRFLGNRRDRHQAEDRQSRKREERLHLRSQLFGLKTELTPLTRHVDLDQNPLMQSFFLRDSINVLRERERIDAVNHFEQRQRVPDFIFLKMPNKMPVQVRWQVRNFYPRFLHSTFSE